MNTSKIIAAVLIVISLGMGYIGINKISDSTNQINFLGLKIDADNETGQMKGYFYLGLAVVLFAGGLYTLKGRE